MSPVPEAPADEGVGSKSGVSRGVVIEGARRDAELHYEELELGREEGR